MDMEFEDIFACGGVRGWEEENQSIGVENTVFAREDSWLI